MGQTQSGSEKEVGLQNIQELYRKFASECPSGNLHLHEFKKIFGINMNSSEEEVAYMENVFRSFDTNKVMTRHHVEEEKMFCCLINWFVCVDLMISLHQPVNNWTNPFVISQDGQIDFMEYVAAVHLVLRGKLEDKLKWSFKVYDRDGNGCLDRQEVKHIVRVSFHLLNNENSQ